MFVTVLYLIDVLVADYILTPLMVLSLDGEIMPLPLRPAYKIAKKSLKHRTYVKFAITKVNLRLADFVRNG